MTSASLYRTFISARSKSAPGQSRYSINIRCSQVTHDIQTIAAPGRLKREIVQEYIMLVCEILDERTYVKDRADHRNFIKLVLMWLSVTVASSL